MTEFHIYLIIVVFMAAFLNSNFGWIGVRPQKSTDNLMLIEQLASKSSKNKNYRRPPVNHTTFGYAINGSIENGLATLEYKFPIINGKEARFDFKLETPNFSSVISQFGALSSCFGQRDSETFELKTSDENYLREKMNSDGFFFRSMLASDWGMDYNHVIDISTELCTKIAQFIALELQNSKKDSYINRVQAVLNFVQYIPYGVPNFDTIEHCYFGVALPHESMAISYSDCDSKSALFAGILRHLIKNDNIILVSCTIDEGGHMVVGVSDLPFNGQRISHNGKDYLLLETTIPIAITNQQEQRFRDINIVNVKSA